MKTKLGMEFTLGRMCLCGALVIALTGCCGNKFWNCSKTSSIQDVGAIHIAVLTVSTFEKYRDSVQPQFKLSTDDALNQVLPSTLALEERIVNLLGLSLKLKAGLPSSMSSEATTAAGQSGSQSSADQGSAPTSKSADSSGSTTGTPTAASLPGGGSVTGATLGQDPLLKFWTAAALYQEVQLLNRYVQDAAIPEGFAAFVVRLQVSLLPWARNEPYDAYADISFFMGDFFLKNPSEQELKWDGRTSPNEVRILPLLVTDDIEAALEARSFDRIRQLALGLSAVIKGVGLESNLESVNEKLQSVTGRDYNSAFTLARASHNTLRVRFGALNQGSARYSMIPQTHNVTLLLMVPTKILDAAKPGEEGRDGRTVRLVSRTAIVDAQSGEELKDNYSNYFTEQFKEALLARGIHEIPREEVVYSLQRFVAANDYAMFRKYVNETLPGAKIQFLESLWVDLAELREVHRYQTATLTLPEYKPVLGLHGQIPLLIDDGKSSISTKLVGVRNSSQKRLQVGLKAWTCSQDKNVKFLEGICKLLDKEGKVVAEAPPKEVYLPATSIKPDFVDSEFVVTFPSLQAVKRQPINDEAEVVVSTGDEHSQGKTHKGVYAVVEKSPSFALSILPGVINSDEKGQGMLVVNIKKAPDSEIFPTYVTLKIGGADFNKPGETNFDPAIIRVSPDPTKDQDPRSLRVNKPGTVTLALFNLNTESNVTVYGTDEAGTSSTPITVRVVSLPSSKQKKQE